MNSVYLPNLDPRPTVSNYPIRLRRSIAKQRTRTGVLIELYFNGRGPRPFVVVITLAAGFAWTAALAHSEREGKRIVKCCAYGFGLSDTNLKTIKEYPCET